MSQAWVSSHPTLSSKREDKLLDELLEPTAKNSKNMTIFFIISEYHISKQTKIYIHLLQW